MRKEGAKTETGASVQQEDSPFARRVPAKSAPTVSGPLESGVENGSRILLRLRKKTGAPGDDEKGEEERQLGEVKGRRENRRGR